MILGGFLAVTIVGKLSLATSLVSLTLVLTASPETLAKLTPAIGEANIFRVIFFTLTFFSIGVLSNFRKLWQDGVGKLAAEPPLTTEHGHTYL